MYTEKWYCGRNVHGEVVLWYLHAHDGEDEDNDSKNEAEVAQSVQSPSDDVNE